MYFDDTIDELTKQIQDMEEGTMYRNSFVSSTPKDQGVRPKDVFVTRNDSGLGSRESSMSRKGDNKKEEGDTLPLPIDNIYVREKDKIDKSKYRHTDNTDNSGVKIKPCKYDGSTPWMDYLSHFEMCALSAHLKSDSRLQVKLSYTECSLKKASESLPELGQSIRRLSNLACPTAPLDVREALGKEQFIDALVDSEMRLIIKQSRPKGLNDAVRLAVELEAYNNAENKIREGRGYLRQPER
ncbi:unnamed protein product [Mytilus coruscus]|uniref:Uncharacterized protein n=1 Tax=Mytilus coruscus TaxID=42192 RepID=A0A6J8DZD2_MYTCO|nr:unnamed protein product [Mytilus coruscus]